VRPLLGRLGGLGALKSLSFDCPGGDVQWLTFSADGPLAASLTSLRIDAKFRMPLEGYIPCRETVDINFVRGFGQLASLELLGIQLAAPPAWLASLPALRSFKSHLLLTPDGVAALSALTALRELGFGAWAPAVGAPTTACCPGITQLTAGELPQTQIFALAAVFPGAVEVDLKLKYKEALPPPHPGAPAWSGVSSLRIVGADYLLEEAEDGAPSSFLQLLRQLGVLDGGLRTLSVAVSKYLGYRSFGDAEISELLLHAPPTLERLYMSASNLTDAAVASCPRRPALTLLGLMPPSNNEQSKLTATALLALGRALPRLERLDLIFFDDDYHFRGDAKWQERSWVKKLDEIDNSDAVRDGAANDGDWDDSDSYSDSLSDSGGMDRTIESGICVARAIRRALEREAVAGAPPPA
jgi:hypothetical protein